MLTFIVSFKNCLAMIAHTVKGSVKHPSSISVVNQGAPIAQQKLGQLGSLEGDKRRATKPYFLRAACSEEPCFPLPVRLCFSKAF